MEGKVMSRIVVCMDCPYYRNGGYCHKKRKDVGALNSACDEIKEELVTKEKEDIMETKVTTPETPTLKICKRCGKELPIEQFGKKKGPKDGRQYWCKQCMTEAMTEARKKRRATTTDKAIVTRIAVRETMTHQQMVDTLRAAGFEVTCRRTIIEEL